MRAGECYGLTRRDLAVLEDLARMRYLKTSQIESLHFPSRRVANRRLEVLARADYIDRFRLPTLIGQGSSEYIHCLKDRGGDLLSALFDFEQINQHRPRRNGRPGNFFLMEHHLAINDFWIVLERACRASGVELLRFFPEYWGRPGENGGLRRLVAGEAPDPERPGRKLRFVPDAVFVLGRKSRRALFFLEIDRGTEKLSSPRYPAFERKLRAYRGCFHSGGFRRWGRDFRGFRVLVVAPSDRRAANLLRLGRQAGLQKMLWVGVREQVAARGPLGRVWRVPEGEELRSLLGEDSRPG